MDVEFKISKNPVNYKKALMFLEKRVELVKRGGKELVWLLEHPLTYSAGIRSKKEDILICNIDFKKVENARQHWPFLRDRRIDFYKGILKNPVDE